MDSAQYAELFLSESREHLTAINQQLLELERRVAAGEGTAEPLSAIFRSVHTVKGMSATMGYSAVADLSPETRRGRWLRKSVDHTYARHVLPENHRGAGRRPNLLRAARRSTPCSPARSR